MKKHRRCDKLGICQGLSADQCPDCDSFECEVACSEPPRPTFPFAPGVIQADGGQQIIFLGKEPFPYSLKECLYIAALVIVLAFGSGYLVEWMS